jgi:hypothetical protein
MTQFHSIRQKHLQLGISSDNVDFAIDAVKEGTKREHIIETLMADYRGMTVQQSTLLLEDLFAANGGEFKKENRGGYLYATLLLLVGFTCSGFSIAMLVEGGFRLKFLILFIGLAVFGLGTGSRILFKAIRGKYRDDDDPFSDKAE